MESQQQQVLIAPWLGPDVIGFQRLLRGLQNADAGISISSLHAIRESVDKISARLTDCLSSADAGERGSSPLREQWDKLASSPFSNALS